jgi:hypothetical protein
VVRSASLLNVHGLVLHFGTLSKGGSLCVNKILVNLLNSQYFFERDSSTFCLYSEAVQ